MPMLSLRKRKKWNFTLSFYNQLCRHHTPGDARAASCSVIHSIFHIFRNGFLRTLEKFSQEAVDEGYDGLDFLNALYGISRECNTTDKHNYGDISHEKVAHIKQKG